MADTNATMTGASSTSAALTTPRKIARIIKMTTATHTTTVTETAKATNTAAAPGWLGSWPRPRESGKMKVFEVN